MSSTPTDSALLLAGVVLRAHGLHGEVVVDVHTDSPDAGSPTAPCSSRGGQARRTAPAHHGEPTALRAAARPLRRGARPHGRRGACAAPASSSPPRALPAPDDPDEFHVHQLEGLRAELVDGAVVGVVSGVIHGPGGELLVVRREGADDALVPFVHAIVPTVDLAGGRVVLTPPEGLLD
jgi:16S rRNA processing protein RimM